MSAHGGIIQFNKSPVDKRSIETLSLACAKYAPDSQDTWDDASLAAFYRSFYATKESRREHQPHVSTEGTVILLDGRLDNRDELVRLLGTCTSDCRTDASIVATAYETWGTECLAKLLGDWALVVWDPRARTLHLAVDYMGIRHLYYSVTKERLVWCTHLEPLVLYLKPP